MHCLQRHWSFIIIVKLYWCTSGRDINRNWDLLIIMQLKDKYKNKKVSLVMTESWTANWSSYKFEFQISRNVWSIKDVKCVMLRLELWLEKHGPLSCGMETSEWICIRIFAMKIFVVYPSLVRKVHLYWEMLQRTPLCKTKRAFYELPHFLLSARSIVIIRSSLGICWAW